MKNKHLVILLSALSAGALGLQAQTAPAPAAPSSSWTLTTAFVSQYMFRGVRLGGFSFQPSVEYSSGPWVAGIWANKPISDKVPGVSDPELDFYGSYTETVNDSLNFATGITIYHYPHADKSQGFYEWTFEPNVTVNYTIAGFKLSPKVYVDTALNGPTAEFTAAYALPLKDMGTELDFTATIGTYKWSKAAENASPDVKNYGNYWLVGVSAPFQITPNSKLVLGMAYTEGYDNYLKTGSQPKVKNSAAVHRGVASLSYSLSF